ncbi:MAG: EF-hand domain-containing protein [Candidatus Melainabacteria bacterium]|nr:EF-hand domain-containing protein [Candidatus Melainabacteria bacterium]
MSNQDEESKDSNLPGYQFFSTDLNYNYFTEQTNNDAPLAVIPAVTPAVTPVVTPAVTPVVTPVVTPAVLPISSVSNFVMDVPLNPYTPSSTDFVANLAAQAAAPVVEVEPVRVEYSLNDDGPELTFEERVAAMEREIAAADAASIAAQAAADAIAQATAVRAAAERAATQPISPIPTYSRFPDVEPIPAQYLQAPAPAETSTQSDEKWNTYVQPNCAPDVFSPDFNFNRSLLKIFWRIDIDHNNRVSRNELAQALQENWFGGDEKLLAKLLFEMYDDISPEAIFCDAGLSVNNILNFGPFGDMAKEELEAQIPEPPAPVRNNPPKKKNTKSSQSLRSMFKS